MWDEVPSKLKPDSERPVRLNSTLRSIDFLLKHCVVVKNIGNS